MNNVSDSFYNMLVLMTTSNYPDVMMPAYQMSRMNFLFFGTFLLLGMFTIMNLMLAIIYSNFKNYFELAIEDMEEIRSNYFAEKFKLYSGGEDYLDEIQMYKTFILINALTLGDDSDQIDKEQEEFIEAEFSKSDENTAGKLWTQLLTN